MERDIVGGNLNVRVREDPLIQINICILHGTGIKIFKLFRLLKKIDKIVIFKKSKD